MQLPEPLSRNSRPPSSGELLRAHVQWSIYHEGCDLYYVPVGKSNLLSAVANRTIRDMTNLIQDAKPEKLQSIE